MSSQAVGLQHFATVSLRINAYLWALYRRPENMRPETRKRIAAVDPDFFGDRPFYAGGGSHSALLLLLNDVRYRHGLQPISDVDRRFPHSPRNLSEARDFLAAPEVMRSAALQALRMLCGIGPKGPMSGPARDFRVRPWHRGVKRSTLEFAHRVLWHCEKLAIPLYVSRLAMERADYVRHIVTGSEAASVAPWFHGVAFQLSHALDPPLEGWTLAALREIVGLVGRERFVGWHMPDGEPGVVYLADKDGVIPHEVPPGSGDAPDEGEALLRYYAGQESGVPWETAAEATPEQIEEHAWRAPAPAKKSDGGEE